MYLYSREKKNANGEPVNYYQVCRSYRDENGKSKREVLADFGKIDNPRILIELKKLASKLPDAKSTKDIANLIDEELELEWSKLLGPNMIFRKLWNDLKLNEVLAGKYHEHVFMMVINRLCDPKSKLRCMRWKEDVYEPSWDDIKVQDLYKSLDWLMKKKDKIEVQLFNNVKDLFNQDSDLILFDTTSVSYYGEGEYAPELLKFGYSKDKRNDLKQLIVGVLMTRGGLPVAHEVFPGNQIDLMSFPEVVAKAKDKFNLKKIVWVCDRGMISEKNLHMLEELKQEYIIGVRMRQMESGLRAVLLDDYHKGATRLSSNLWVKEQEIEGRRYIVCHNPEQAKIDAQKREYFKKIIQRKVAELDDKSWIIKNGFKKYLKLTGDIIEGIDYDRLEKEKIYDGKWILLTNTKIDFSEIARHYKSLSQIESAFRELKSTLDVKPIYHWTERRIRGHIFICFLALILELGLQNKLVKVSYSDVLEDLKKLKVSMIKVGEIEKYKRTKLVGKTEYAFEQLKLTIPSVNL